MNQNNNQLATTNNQGQTLTTFNATDLPDWFSPGGGTGFFTPMPISTDEQYAQVNRMALTKDVLLVDMIGEHIKVRGWLASPWQGINEETGKEETGVRIGLLLDDNRVAVTYSFGVRKSLILAVGRYGSKEWDPPVPFIVADTKAKLGRMLVLLPAPAASPAQAGKGRGK